MSNFYVNQGNVTITNDTGVSVAGADVTQIIYTKPNGDRGAWNATPSGDTLTYQIQTGDVDRNGNWRLQAYISSGGQKGYGSIVTVRFKLPLN